MLKNCKKFEKPGKNLEKMSGNPDTLMTQNILKVFKNLGITQENSGY